MSASASIMTDEDLDALAGEFVLGTLTAEERETVGQLAANDPGFAGRIATWERRLGTLEQMVEAIDPPTEVWEHIRARIAEVSPGAAFRLPELTGPAREQQTERAEVGGLARSIRRWRAIAGIVGAIAVVLVVMLVLGRYRPDLLPSALQPPVLVQTR
jgi:anti-sigma-K factor RskA